MRLEGAGIGAGRFSEPGCVAVETALDGRRRFLLIGLRGAAVGMDGWRFLWAESLRACGFSGEPLVSVLFAAVWELFFVATRSAAWDVVGRPVEEWVVSAAMGGAAELPPGT